MFKTKIIDTEIDGIAQWLWPEEDEGLWYGPHLHWPAVKEELKKHCKKFDTIIQAGGAAGMYPRLLSEIFNTVYTFEPDILNFYCLSANCQKENIVKINSALGDKHSMVGVNRNGSNAGCNTVNEQVVDGIIPILRIDDFNFNSVDAIYLDVEGYEAQIIRGAVETIKKFKPLIGAEGGVKEEWAFLEQLGYKEVSRAHADTIYKVVE